MAVLTPEQEASVRTQFAPGGQAADAKPKVAEGKVELPPTLSVKELAEYLDVKTVDIIPWSDEPSQLVANALSPAQVLTVEIDRESRTATAQVPENQLSLAIGKDGQNARLAAKLTGWRIDIKPSVEEASPQPDSPPEGEGDVAG